MDHYLVDIHWLSEAFGGDRNWKFDLKPTDGTTIFAYLGKGEKNFKKTVHKLCCLKICNFWPTFLSFYEVKLAIFGPPPVGPPPPYHDNIVYGSIYYWAKLREKDESIGGEGIWTPVLKN